MSVTLAAALVSTLIGAALARPFDRAAVSAPGLGLALALVGGVLWVDGSALGGGTLVWTLLLVAPLVALALLDMATRQVPDLLSALLVAGGAITILYAFTLPKRFAGMSGG